jgi:hypothetical protein
MNGFGGNSNFPPGHPTGTSISDERELIYHCDRCSRYIRESELVVVPRDGSFDLVVCPTCNNGDKLAREHCDTCGAPATHIDEDRSVNFFLAFCSKHFMGQRLERI